MINQLSSRSLSYVMSTRTRDFTLSLTETDSSEKITTPEHKLEFRGREFASSAAYVTTRTLVAMEVSFVVPGKPFLVA